MTKRYHPAQTGIGDKRRLEAQYRELNPAELQRQIRNRQEKLLWRSQHKRPAWAGGGR